MPPKRKKREEQQEAPIQPDEQNVIQGAPEDGDEYQGDGVDPQQMEMDLGGEPEPAPQQGDLLMQQVMQRLDEQGQLIKNLTKRMPPDMPVQQQAQEPAPEGPDFEKLIFEDPNKALQMHGEIVAKRVREELTQMYQREQGTKQFWDKFYDANQDLKGDRDLVELTLNAHLSEMADMPVDEAITKLADLTRQRILRYAGKQEKGSKRRPVVEGATQPHRPQAAPQEPEISTLSDLIKARQARKATAT